MLKYIEILIEKKFFDVVFLRLLVFKENFVCNVFVCGYDFLNMF